MNMDLNYFLISVFLGLIPEVLFYTFFLIHAKNIKRHKILLFILIAVADCIYMVLSDYKVINYLFFIISVYVILKILYKKKAQIIDVFTFSVAFMYVCLISYLCFLPVNNNITTYYIMFVIDRILLIVPFLFKNKFNILYKKYCNLWNRNDKEKRRIKSITLRNVSLISLNLFIFLCNLGCLYILNIKEG